MLASRRQNAQHGVFIQLCEAGNATHAHSLTEQMNHLRGLCRFNPHAFKWTFL
jgi:hypothetical protein